MQASVEIVRYREGHAAESLRAREGTFAEAFGVRASISHCPGGFRVSVEAVVDVDAVGIDLVFVVSEWSRGYVLVPGAAYDGNRFRVLDRPYPPIYDAEAPEDVAPVVTDVPRLPSLRLLAGDASWPAIGLWDAPSGTAHVVGFPAETSLGAMGLRVEEDEGSLTVRIQFPGVRHGGRFSGGRTDAPCGDRGASLRAGETMTAFVAAESLQVASVAGLFEAMDERRHRCVALGTREELRPLSSVADLIVEDMGRRTWRPGRGFFATSDGDGGIDFQTGWVGGGMGTLALVESADADMAGRARRNVDFLCTTMQAPSGFFYGGIRETICGDGFGHPHAEHWGMVRKSGDALLFLMRHILAEASPPPAWESAARRCADAFAQTWDRHGDWGQLIDVRDGRVVIGGSACGGTAIAGLALAAKFFAEETYLRTARLAADHYAITLRHGVLNGGPGEILKAPDSESAFGLLEGYMALFEAAGESCWVELARETAFQAASWVVPYDFPFPAGSTFGCLGMCSAGTVIANVQNKHSAPGICTGSALPLLKLFRVTGERRWLDLTVEISHALPQYVSSLERPIRADDGRDLLPGWINERVNLSDWESPGRGPGEVFYGSCWCATTLLLTELEMPGVYVQPQTGLVACADHVLADLGGGRLTVTNPTAYPARLRILVDDDPRRPLGELWWRKAIRLRLDPGETQSLALPETESFAKSP